jgi:oxygen-independent coproporphyrinogen-3 oxidase
MTGAAPPREPPLGVYLHYPFCQARCAYCAFYTVADSPAARHQFVQSVAAEIERVARQGRVGPGLILPPPAGRSVDSIYLGGGTPSLLTPGDVAALLARVRDHFRVLPGAEITLEANPETVSAAAAEGWLTAGVNRVSLGAQTFDDAVLRALGRGHDQAAIHSAVRALRRTGCENLSLDVLAGVAAECLDEDLEKACDLAPEHLSLYLLEVDEEEVGRSTPLKRRLETGLWQAPGADWLAEAYDRGVERLQRAGLGRYEICNFARDGRACRHNLKYWRSQEVLGFGPSAHSLMAGVRFAVADDLEGYIGAVTAGSLPALHVDGAGLRQRASETFILGLRLAAGIDPAGLERQLGIPLTAGQWREVERVREAGLVAWHGKRLRLTARGMLLANEVFQAFLPDVCQGVGVRRPPPGQNGGGGAKGA